MKVLIDARETGSMKSKDKRYDRAKEYFTGEGCDCEVSQLLVGDYVFGDKVVFEYKTVSDFMSSVFNGSVFEEVVNQTNCYPYSYLVIVGDLGKYIRASYYCFSKSKDLMSWDGRQRSAYKGAVRRLRVYCPVIVVKDEEEAFEEMLLQSRKCLNPRFYGGVKRCLPSNSVVTHTLSGARFIRDKVIVSVVECLGVKCLSQLLGFGVEDFMGVPLVGERRARIIYEWLHQGEEEVDDVE